MGRGNEIMFAASVSLHNQKPNGPGAWYAAFGLGPLNLKKKKNQKKNLGLTLTLLRKDLFFTYFYR